MALSRNTGDQSQVFNTQYNISFDMSGWDRSTIQVVAPMSGTLYPYASNDPNALKGVRDGNASLATNFTTVQVTNLATGSAVTAITAAGEYKYDVNAQFLRLQGNPAATPTSVYRLILNHSK